MGSTSFNSLGVSLVAQRVKNLPAMLETWVRSLGWKIPWRRDRPPTPTLLGFSCGSAGKESACNSEDLGSIPGLEDPLKKGNSTHFNNGVIKSWT